MAFPIIRASLWYFVVFFPAHSTHAQVLLFNFNVLLVEPEFDLKITSNNAYRIQVAAFIFFFSFWVDAPFLWFAHVLLNDIRWPVTVANTNSSPRHIWFVTRLMSTMTSGRAIDPPTDNDRLEGISIFIEMSFNCSVSAVVKWIIAAITFEWGDNDKDWRTSIYSIFRTNAPENVMFQFKFIQIQMSPSNGDGGNDNDLMPLTWWTTNKKRRGDVCYNSI